MRQFVSVVVISTILAFSVLATTPDVFGKGQALPTVMSKQYGYGLQQSREGMPLLVSKMFFNTRDVPQNITIVFDIRKDNISMYLVLQEEAALPRDTALVSVSWTPQIAGEYQIRSFVISNMTKPEVLENVAASGFNIMSDEDFVTLYSDRPTSFSITPVEPVLMSPTTPSVTFNDERYLGSGHNTGIGDVSISGSGLYVIGSTEVPPIGENPSADVLNQLVYFTASNDRGMTFEPMRYLVNNSQTLTFTSSPLVHAVNDTFLYVSWLLQDYYKDEFKLVVSRSLNGGETLTDPIGLDHDGVILGGLDMAVSKDGKFLYTVRTEVYHDGEPGLSTVVFSRSSDYAKSFGPAQRIVNHTSIDEIRCAQILVREADDESGNNAIYVTWRQNSEKGGMKLLFTASYDNGATFGQPIVIREAYTEDYDCPVFASHGEDVYISWAETKLIYKPEDPSEILVGDTDIFFAASRDSGRSFESPVNLSEGVGAFTMESEMLVSEGRIYVAWRDTIPEVNDNGIVSLSGSAEENAEVVMTRSLDGGRTFEKPVNLSNNPSGSYEPEIAMHGDNVYVIWMESTFPSNEAQVSLRISSDGGRTFGGIAENIVGSIPEPVSRPRVLTSPDGEQIFILWSQMPADEYTVHMYALTGAPFE